MSDESQEDVTLESTETDDSAQDDAADDGVDWKAAALKYRKEAERRRHHGKDLDAKLKEYDDWKKSQMSEVERAKAEKAEVEEELKKLKGEKVRGEVAKKAKLDPDLADRIKGDTEEEMLEDARRLAKKYPASASANADTMFAGSRGNPVGHDKEESESDWFRKQFNKS